MKVSSIGKMLTVIFFAVMAFIIFSSFAVAYETPECAYGTFDAWYSKDGVEWQNTTVDHAELKRGEPFYIKVTFTTKTEPVWVAMELTETGEDSANDSSFEMIEGPCGLYEMKDFGELSTNVSFTHTWKLRVKPDTGWAGGNAPLNVGSFFDKKVNGEWHTEDISFTAVNVYIIDELWEGYIGDDSTNNDDGETSDAPSFELVIVLAAVSLLVLKRRKS